MSRLNKKIIIFGILAFISVVLVSTFIITNNSKKYTVTFNSNGGTAISSEKVKNGECVKRPKDPEKEGYIFVEWQYNNQIFDFSTKINEDIILEAKYQEVLDEVEMIKVAFDSNGGTTISNQIIKKGEKIIKPEDPIKEGYVFKGWKLDSEEYSFDFIVEKDITLVADYEKIETKPNSQTNSNKPSGSTSKPTDSNKPANNTKPAENNNNNSTQNTVKLKKPILEETGRGGSIGEDGLETFGISVKISNFDASGSEIYISDSENGTYKLWKTLSKSESQKENIILEVNKGECKYFKIRTFVGSQNKIYSEYSNIIEIDNNL